MATDPNAHLKELPWASVLGNATVSVILTGDRLAEARADLALTGTDMELSQAAVEHRLLAQDHLAKADRLIGQAKGHLHAAIELAGVDG